ncbi:MAG: adenylate kinase [Streptococcaceae bacterium]|jgi:adenylate kinase|nr:adenylate kinase [Streptococcaceae bacterium]
MNILIMGLPGAGKGTQAEKIIDTYQIPHISTGDMFREAMAEGTDMGKLAKSYIDRGELVPDKVTNGIVKERLDASDVATGFLLDGFPRTIDQAYSLTEILESINKTVDYVINIDVNPEILVERLSGRFICKDCGATYHKVFNPPRVEGTCDRCGGHNFFQREDDKPETVKNRLEINIKQSAPILEYYRKQNLVYDINGNQAIDQVFKEVQAVLDN